MTGQYVPDSRSGLKMRLDREPKRLENRRRNKFSKARISPTVSDIFASHAFQPCGQQMEWCLSA
jgi:hypothetical protein